MQSKNHTQPMAAQLKKVRIMYWWALASAAFTVDSSNFSEKANIYFVSQGKHLNTWEKTLFMILSGHNSCPRI